MERWRNPDSEPIWTIKISKLQLRMRTFFARCLCLSGRERSEQNLDSMNECNIPKARSMRHLSTLFDCSGSSEYLRKRTRSTTCDNSHWQAKWCDVSDNHPGPHVQEHRGDIAEIGKEEVEQNRARDRNRSRSWNWNITFISIRASFSPFFSYIISI